MNEKKTEAIGVAEMRNEETYPSPEALAFMDDRTKYHLRALEHRYLLHESMRPTREERDLKTKLRSRVLDKLDVREDYESLLQLGRDRLDATVQFPRLVHDGPGSVRSDPFFDMVVGDGVMVFWARTTWFFPASVATIWMDGDGVHFAADVRSSDGDLHTYAIRVVAQFEIRPDRMPPKGRNYSSNPVFEVSGPVFGLSFPRGLLSLQDCWSKCWLNTKQTVFTVTGFDGIIRTAGSNSDSRQVIFIEDDDPVQKNLPGLMGMPVNFLLPESADALIIELEWEIDIQIENGSLVLGHRPEAQVCTIRHPQWNIREL